jgi:uncharacterized LabA/DUF88 family protein
LNTDKDNPRLAVLIDADNARANIIEGLLAEVAKFGIASVKRIYGDWTTPNLGQWKTVLLEHSIQPIQQFRYTTGKNATDSAMIIDAMDLLYTETFDGFCIVSSDSDFTRLASRIRESGKRVYGFGERKTPRPFLMACDRFIYTDNLLITSENIVLESNNSILTATKSPDAKPEQKKIIKDDNPINQVQKKLTGKELRQDTKLMNLIRKAIEVLADESGFADLSGLGNYISKQAPDFFSTNYGYDRLSSLIEAIGYFEINKAGHKVFIKNVKK